jgi:hypothetical protein
MRVRREKRRSLLRDTRGLSAAEYIILMALICVVGFLAWRIFGSRTRERTAGAHGVVNGLATTSSADGESGAHGGQAGGSHGADGEEAARPEPGAPPHGGQGDIQRGRRLSVPGQEGEFGEDPEVTASRRRGRNLRWIVIGVLTAGVMAILLGKKRG